jgi:F-type H+-transporting ATPase subunit b
MSDNSTAPTKGGLPTIVVVLIGLLLMFGGFYVSKNVEIAFLKGLEEQGLPLDPGKTIAVIGVLMILFPVVNLFYVKPLDDAIQSRNSELESTFTEAENLRSTMTQMKTDYERRLAATEAAAREQIQKEIAEARRLADEKVAAINGQINEMRAKAEEDIERQKQGALTELRVMVTNLTLAATEKVLRANVDSDANRKLIDEFISEVEVKA